MEQDRYPITLHFPNGCVYWRSPSREAQLARLTSLLTLDPMIFIEHDDGMNAVHTHLPGEIKLVTKTRWKDGRVVDRCAELEHDLDALFKVACAVADSSSFRDSAVSGMPELIQAIDVIRDRIVGGKAG